ncbi:hypothetical protein CBR_g25971 [Chara braunii]|uniref:Integrase catalytic domain-containing protein n=1 Tax=Chara braunii TaxID=69332 RepID=A0A388L6W6_CHABU|nr:hypothetical protein CBR_g25971 [Chara braunii]|eukprot:GBG78036.1 hypothetical protein CBR_g25971 [Chara braunii]
MANITSKQWKVMLDAVADNERPFFHKLYEDVIHREREAEAAARATSIAEQVALLAVPESNDDRFRKKIAAVVAALVQLRTLEDLESRVTALEQRNQELQAEIVSLKPSQLSAPRPPNPRPAAVPVSHPNTILVTRASGTVTSAGTGANSSSGSTGSTALVIVPNAGTSAQNATVLTGVQYNGPVVDKRAATLPSKYDGKGDITSWISFMHSYFEVLRTSQEDRSMIMGTNTEPVVRSFIELQAVTASYERIDLTEWLKVTPVRTLEDLLITQYQDKHAVLKARLKLEALKGQTCRTTMQALEQHLTGLFTTPNLGLIDVSCMDVVMGVTPKEYVCQLGLKDHTTWRELLTDLVNLEAKELARRVKAPVAGRTSQRKRYGSSNQRALHEHRGDEDQSYADDVSLDDDLEPDCDVGCSTSALEFISADWKDFTSQIYDIKLNKTSGRHPEANGLAEEINQTVIQLLRALIVPDQNTWDKELHKVKGLYNNSIHSATGVTPNQLQYGWKMRNPLSYLFPERSPGLTPDMLGYNAKYARLLKAAIAAMNKRQHAMIKHANKSRKEANFKVGDYIWVKMSEFCDEEGVSRKLLPLYYGPWQVLKVIGDEFGPSYVIDVPPHLRTYLVFHASKLFPHIDDETFPFRDPMIPRTIDDDHEIHKIISHEDQSLGLQSILEYGAKGATNETKMGWLVWDDKFFAIVKGPNMFCWQALADMANEEKFSIIEDIIALKGMFVQTVGDALKKQLKSGVKDMVARAKVDWIMLRSFHYILFLERKKDQAIWCSENKRFRTEGQLMAEFGSQWLTKKLWNDKRKHFFDKMDYMSTCNRKPAMDKESLKDSLEL